MMFYDNLEGRAGILYYSQAAAYMDDGYVKCRYNLHHVIRFTQQKHFG